MSLRLILVLSPYSLLLYGMSSLWHTSPLPHCGLKDHQIQWLWVQTSELQAKISIASLQTYCSQLIPSLCLALLHYLFCAQKALGPLWQRENKLRIMKSTEN